MKKILVFFFILLGFMFTSAANAAEVFLNSTTTNTAVSSGTYSVAIFANNLSVGSYGKDVMALKKIISLELNTTLDTSATFTANTANDVKNLQEKYAVEILIPNGLSTGTGFVGASTRAKLNQLTAKYSIKISDFTLPTVSTARSVFTTTLQLGSSGDDVSLLKIVLNSDDDTKIAMSASGVTNIFDLATQASVNKFQEKYADEILTPGGLTGGTGIVGPATRKKLNFILNNILSSIKNPNAATTSNKSLLTVLSSASTTAQINNLSNTSTVTTPPVSVLPPITGKADSFPPTITFNAEPVQLSPGQQTTLIWSANNASGQCKLTSKDSSGNTFSSTVNSSGSGLSGSINQTTTYTIVCYNKYGIPGTKSISISIISANTTTTSGTQVTYVKAATITSITPSSANRGDAIKITGTGFLLTNNVIFDGAVVDDSLVLSVSSSSISFIIPQYKSCSVSYCPLPKTDTTVETGGPRIIQVSNTNGYSNDYTFNLPSKIITIAGTSNNPLYSSTFALNAIQPTSGNRGDIAVISGSGFSSDSIILFGGFKVSDNLIISRTSNSLSFVVPPFQFGCTNPDYEICPRLPITGSGTVIETGGPKDVYVMNLGNKATTTSVIFTLPSNKITY